jgi:tRNA pseudouridine55 synthase
MVEKAPAAEQDASAAPDAAQVSGLLLVDKPAGMTSHDVVEIARRAYGERSIGHLGTLDPFATGLLVLLLGRATRLGNFLNVEPKVYEALIQFGSETDTDDATGVETRSAPVPSETAIRERIPKLTGTLPQIPPDYSAKSVDGTRAYKAARKGNPVEQKPVSVTVTNWDIHEIAGGSVRATITCSGGTYIRALARDLGRLTGSAAHLSELRRLAIGPFTVEEAMSLDVLKVATVAPKQLKVVVSDE